MKYSLMILQPSSKAVVALSTKSSALIPLLITCRSRSLPASGASVKPVFRTFLISFISSGVREPTRRLGKETAMLWSA